MDGRALYLTYMRGKSSFCRGVSEGCLMYRQLISFYYLSILLPLDMGA